MALVKTAEEIRKYISIDGSFDFNTLLPYIEPAEDDVKNVLGKGQYTELDDYYNGANTGIAELDELLPYAQRPIIYFAFLRGIDKINVSIGNNGIGVIHNNNIAPASKERVENLKKNTEASAWDALEYLLQFLEENAADYPNWESSDAYAVQYAFLIPSARAFDKLYKINRSRLTFLQWRPTIADVEKLQIEPVISKEMLDELKGQVKTGTVTTANQKILPFVQKAEAYLTAAIKQDEKMQQPGERYLMMAKSIMDGSPADYPTYTASDVYDAGLANYEPYENDPDLNIAVFGV